MKAIPGNASCKHVHNKKITYNRKTIYNRKNNLDSLIIILVLLWILFLLFSAGKIQAAEQTAIIQAYMNNLGALLMDKASFLIRASTLQFF